MELVQSNSESAETVIGHHVSVRGAKTQQVSWTDAEADEAFRLWKTGLSRAQIGVAMGKTRGSVVGKLHRMGVRDAPKIPGPRKKRVYVYRPRPRKAVTFKRLADVTAMAPTGEFACQFLDLTNTTCRWPNGDVGDQGFHFCGSPGADMADNRPYCSFHNGVAYRRPDERKRAA